MVSAVGYSAAAVVSAVPHDPTVRRSRAFPGEYGTASLVFNLNPIAVNSFLYLELRQQPRIVLDTVPVGRKGFGIHGKCNRRLYGVDLHGHRRGTTDIPRSVGRLEDVTVHTVGHTGAAHVLPIPPELFRSCPDPGCLLDGLTLGTANRGDPALLLTGFVGEGCPVLPTVAVGRENLMVYRHPRRRRGDVHNNGACGLGLGSVTLLVGDIDSRRSRSFNDLALRVAAVPPDRL